MGSQGNHNSRSLGSEHNKTRRTSRILDDLWAHPESTYWGGIKKEEIYGLESNDLEIDWGE